MVRLSFETPVLLITGGRDNVISPDTAIDRAKLAVQAGGKAEHVQFALAGHSLTLQSRREEVFDLVANWRWKRGEDVMIISAISCTRRPSAKRSYTTVL